MITGVADSSASAAAVGKLMASNLGMVRPSLRERRDCGAEVDQCLVLCTAVVAMLQYGIARWPQTYTAAYARVRGPARLFFRGPMQP